jgi:hypothetical protein
MTQLYDNGGVLRGGLTTAVNRSRDPERIVRWVHVGQLAGTPVIVSPLLRETDIVHSKGVVLCGRLSHLEYMLTLSAARVGARRHLQQLLDDFAARWGVDRPAKSE